MQSTIGRNPQEDYEIPSPLGFCLLINRSVIDEVGYLDEAYSEGYGCDEIDYWLRAQKLGFTARLSHKAFVYHRAYTSFDAKGNLEQMFERNKQIFKKKWKFTP